MTDEEKLANAKNKCQQLFNFLEKASSLDPIDFILLCQKELEATQKEINILELDKKVVPIWKATYPPPQPILYVNYNSKQPILHYNPSQQWYSYDGKVMTTGTYTTTV